MSKQNKTADLIHSLMMNSDSKAISQTSLKVMKALQNESVENQILGLSSLFLTFLDRYGLNHIDVLGMNLNTTSMPFMSQLCEDV